MSPDEPAGIDDSSESIQRLQAGKIVGGGRALAHHRGDTWLVAGALPGEQVRAVETGRRAGVVEGRFLELIGVAHPAREPRPCPHAESCGGCDWPHVAAEEGARLKATVAAESARHRPELAERLAAAPVRSSGLAHRIRARLHWDPESSVLGFYEPKSWRVTPIPSCRILSARLMQALESLTHALDKRCPQPVDVEWLEDLEGATAVAALRPAPAGPENIDPRWLPTEADIRDAVDGMHRLGSAGWSGRGWGPDRVTMNLPIPLEVPIGSFFQSNRHLVGWLFERVSELIGPDPVATWDLHAGVGLLAAAARHASGRKLWLVERHRPSALAARSNLPSARVAVGRSAESYLDRTRRLPGRSLVITDPPRTGLSRTLLHHLAGWHPERILMLSCDPSTWTRDTGFLVDRGYRLSHLELADLFPSTHHVEVLATLETE